MRRVGGPRCDAKWSAEKRSEVNARRRRRYAEKKQKKENLVPDSPNVRSPDDEWDAFGEEGFKEEYGDVALMMSGKFWKPRMGRTRMVFVDDENNCVYKVPMNSEGMLASSKENKVASDPEKYVVRVAQCEYVNIEGIFVLKMEKVNVDIDPDDKPDWADYVDCGQIGRTVDGRVVAFDL